MTAAIRHCVNLDRPLDNYAYYFNQNSIFKSVFRVAVACYMFISQLMPPYSTVKVLYVGFSVHV